MQIFLIKDTYFDLLGNRAFQNASHTRLFIDFSSAKHFLFLVLNICFFGFMFCRICVLPDLCFAGSTLKPFQDGPALEFAGILAKDNTTLDQLLLCFIFFFFIFHIVLRTTQFRTREFQRFFFLLHISYFIWILPNADQENTIHTDTNCRFLRYMQDEHGV